MLIGYFSINFNKLYSVYTSTADIPNEITMGNHYLSLWGVIEDL